MKGDCVHKAQSLGKYINMQNSHIFIVLDLLHIVTIQEETFSSMFNHLNWKEDDYNVDQLDKDWPNDLLWDVSSLERFGNVYHNTPSGQV